MTSSRSARRSRAVTALIGLAGARLSGVVYRYRRDISLARRPFATGSRIAETPFGPIAYATAGEGPPVLVVQGAGGKFDQAMFLCATLRENGFRCSAGTWWAARHAEA